VQSPFCLLFTSFHVDDRRPPLQRKNVPLPYALDSMVPPNGCHFFPFSGVLSTKTSGPIDPLSGTTRTSAICSDFWIKFLFFSLGVPLTFLTGVDHGPDLNRFLRDDRGKSAAVVLSRPAVRSRCLYVPSASRRVGPNKNSCCCDLGRVRNVSDRVFPVNCLFFSRFFRGCRRIGCVLPGRRLRRPRTVMFFFFAASSP